MRTILGVLMLLSVAGFVPSDADVFRLTSPDFVDGGPIPPRCSLHGDNLPPTLQITGVPKGTKSLVLIVDDPDAPSGLWTHWVVWNITAGTTSIPGGQLPAGAKQGRNSFGNVRYDGPSPPIGTHHYHFHLYALKMDRDLKKMAEGTPRERVEAEYSGYMGSNVLAQAELVGTFTSSP